MNKVNEYILEHWNEYTEDGKPCFTSRDECHEFLLLCEHCGTNLDELHDDPSIFCEKVFWYYGACGCIADLVDAVHSFGGCWKREDNRPLWAYIWEVEVENNTYKGVTDYEDLWESYDYEIKSIQDKREDVPADSWWFEIDGYTFHFGFC